MTPIFFPTDKSDSGHPPFSPAASSTPVPPSPVKSTASDALPAVSGPPALGSAPAQRTTMDTSPHRTTINNVTTAPTMTTLTTSTVLPQRSSGSSDITNITTTTVSSNDDEQEGEDETDRGMPQYRENERESVQDSHGDSVGAEASTKKPLGLSDVTVHVSDQGSPSIFMNGHMESDDESLPPPLPHSSPPNENDDKSGEPSEDGDETSPPSPTSSPPTLSFGALDEGKFERLEIMAVVTPVVTCTIFLAEEMVLPKEKELVKATSAGKTSIYEEDERYMSYNYNYSF